ncbi:MAG: hypothetical protein ABSC19_20230 [Syntrophorhabdales bacterium]|jgi:hypothetical protein
MSRVLKKGNYTDILVKSLGNTVLEAILRAYDGIKEIEEELQSIPRYRGKKVEAPSGETLLKGKGMPEYAGQAFVRILGCLYGLQKKKCLTEKEVHRIETVVARGISRHAPFSPSLATRKGNPPDVAFNYLVYLLYVNIKAKRHNAIFGMVAEFITEQELETSRNLDYKALHDRFLRMERESPVRRYLRVQKDYPDVSLPQWESLFVQGYWQAVDPPVKPSKV